jgi:hypothetical protein
MTFFSQSKADILGRLGELAHRPTITRLLAIALLVASVLSGFVTYLALTGEFGDNLSQTTVNLLLVLNLVLLLLLGAVVSGNWSHFGWSVVAACWVRACICAWCYGSASSPWCRQS